MIEGHIYPAPEIKIECTERGASKSVVIVGAGIYHHDDVLQEKERAYLDTKMQRELEWSGQLEEYARIIRDLEGANDRIKTFYTKIRDDLLNQCDEKDKRIAELENALWGMFKLFNGPTHDNAKFDALNKAGHILSKASYMGDGLCLE